MPPDSSLHLHWRLEVAGTTDPVLRIAQSGGRRLEVWDHCTAAATQTTDTVLQYQVPPSTPPHLVLAGKKIINKNT